MERILDVGTSSLDSCRRRPDHDVLERLDAGDLTGAVNLLMRRHGARVYRFCRAALHDAALADDVLQLVFEQVLRDLPRFQRRVPAVAWILGIAHHRMLDAVRQRGRSQSRTGEIDLDCIEDSAPSALQALDHARLMAALTVALTKLDLRSRAAVLLRYQQGLSFEEMAKVCGEKPGTLQARVARALPRLREIVSRRANRSRASPK
jgi:RNA polymerase sigma-70 factor (ECF subfamily)